MKDGEVGVQMTDVSLRYRSSFLAAVRRRDRAGGKVILLSEQTSRLCPFYSVMPDRDLSTEDRAKPPHSARNESSTQPRL